MYHALIVVESAHGGRKELLINQKVKGRILSTYVSDTNDLVHAKQLITHVRPSLQQTCVVSVVASLGEAENQERSANPLSNRVYPSGIF